MAPRSQKDRPISFVLDDGQGNLTTQALVIRPEDLSRTDQSLLTPTQTFDGAWIDDWGPGLSSILIAGHTGWGSGTRPDGFQAFQGLYDQVWTQWHAKRRTAAQNGRDPNSVKLIFTDTLNEITSVVAPGSFVLKRNRSRPLLSVYQLGMTVISDQVADPDVDPLPLDPNVAKDLPSAVDSLSGSMGTLTSLSGKLGALLDPIIAGPLSALATLTSGTLGQVISTVQGVNGLVTNEARQIIGVASDLALAGRNVAYTVAAVESLPLTAMNAVQAIASAFENAFCVLANALQPPKLFPDYSGLYGASGCSSTFGGSPISAFVGQNPFETIVDSSTLLPAVTSAASAGLNALRITDPVLAPMTLTQLAANVSAVTGGISWSP